LFGKSVPQVAEFHISRKARERLNFDDSLFASSGDVIFPNFRAIQSFADKINAESFRARGFRRDSSVSPGEISAMGLFHEVLHFVINSYVDEISPKAFVHLEDHLKKSIGASEFEDAAHKFVELFPPTSVYRGEESVDEYLRKSDGGKSNRQMILVESILLWLENLNPAFVSISSLIDDKELKSESKYDRIIADADKFFDTQPTFSSVGPPLLKMLRAPMEVHPNSISEQLQFIAKHWEKILSKSPFLLRLLTAVDILKEEGKYFLMLAQSQADKSKVPKVSHSQFGGLGESVYQSVPQFRGQEFESENFSADLNWMPNVVLIAKSAFVWLDQLSKKYRRSITRLDQIPDEELDILASRGFTGLWLIGIWERSHASKRIKHLNGNIDAVASAYSLNSYDVCSDLGGDAAFANLKDRAMKRGIRLASDMVPNHMGIDSTWVINHPDWFLSTDYPPFPNYTFNGPDLGNDDRVGIFIEDGYWTKKDAAVVFKRLDRWTGDVRYIYHGNDGTHMPWNDTAQLDFTRPEVREAVIRTILHVARKFPIIRFDAAMVLAKKHIQRLWFPEPGTGGAIPSRSNCSMTKEHFDSVIPNEFWREVVDRIQKEVPDTLLLAEAFWLMEGYFVRTLGMHRVYNSAFMNMLKREENANYRQVVKNVLEYNPQILKRYVNFLNNPDEETAIAQFGKDDKYFGVCLMMATMPGLPMFGHGQIEGFTEKYGMEYSRAYRDESPDNNLVSRHEREIFPLLKKRRLFSEMDNFLMYDLASGDVNEDVFAYSNRFGDEGSLVVFNNRYSQAAGWIKNSVGFRDNNGKVVQRTLQDGLQLKGGKNDYLIFEDVTTHLEYIRSVTSLKRDGLYVELGAYKYNVFMNFREVRATDYKPYGELCSALNGKGTSSIEDALQDYKLRDVHAAFYEAMNAGSLRHIVGGTEDGRLRKEREKVLAEKSEKLISAVSAYEHLKGSKTGANNEMTEFRVLQDLRKILDELKAQSLSARLPSIEDSLFGWRVIILWLLLDRIKEIFFDERRVIHPFEDWRLIPQVVSCFRELGLEERLAEYESKIVGEMIELIGNEENTSLLQMIIRAMKRDSFRGLIGVNVYDGISWFNKERFEDFLGYLTLAVLIKEIAGISKKKSDAIKPVLKNTVNASSRIERLAAKTNYRLDDFFEALLDFQKIPNKVRF